MKIRNWSWSEDRRAIVLILAQNGVIAGTSDTVFGLMAPATTVGRAALDALKTRSEKPYIILIGSAERIADFSDQELSEDVKKMVDRCWPGPLTLILKAKKGLDPAVQSADGKVALRVPNHPGMLALLQEIPALFSTSANKAGQQPPKKWEELDRSIADQISDCIVEENISGACLPSTIVDCSEKSPVLVRNGAYNYGLLKQFGVLEKKM